MKFDACMGRASAHGLERKRAGECRICIRFASLRSRYILKAVGPLCLHLDKFDVSILESVSIVLTLVMSLMLL